MGGGVLGRIDFRNNWYAEISGKAGSVKSDFYSEDIKFQDIAAEYEYEGMYIGGHLGCGHIFELNEKLEIDASVKYFFTNQGSKDVALPTKEIIKFEGVSSNKIRVGGKLNCKATEVIKPYVGGGIEYELSGKTEAALDGFAVDAPTLEGISGAGEVGIQGTIGKFTIDLGGSGYAGVRTGVNGMLKVKYEI
jgi:outer membrane autotransporter protein